MSPLTLFGIAVSLAMDAFAVAIACSVALKPVQPRQVFRLSFHFGLFQAMMPLIGWLAGRTVADVIGRYDHWAAFGILAFIGLKAIYGAMRGSDEERSFGDPTRGWSLVGLSVATSLDALAVGLSFSLLRVEIWTAVALIGVVAAMATIIGMQIGARLGMALGRRMEFAGGVILVAIGVRILIDHLGGGG